MAQHMRILDTMALRDIHLTPSLFASLLRVAPVYNSILMKFSLCCVTGCALVFTAHFSNWRISACHANSHALFFRIDKTRDEPTGRVVRQKTPVSICIHPNASICLSRPNEKKTKESIPANKIRFGCGDADTKNMTLPPAVNQVE